VTPEDVSGNRISDERYRAFIESISDGVYEVDIHGNYTYFNTAFCRVLGYSREEIQFQNFSKFMDEADARATFEIFNKIYRTGEGIIDFVWRIIDREGEIRTIELSANLITNKQGEPIGFRGVARDVTERVRTQEALRKSEWRYRTLLDFVPYPMVVFNLEGKVTYLNPAFTDIFGWTLEELIGKNIPYVPPGLEQETSETIRRLIQEKMILRHETKRMTKDGRVLDVVMRAAVFSESRDDSAGELVILRDITREKRIAKNNEAMLRISMALPEYPDLEDLLDFVANEVKRLLDSEGALVILLDEQKQELFFMGAAYDDETITDRVKEIRFPIDKLVAGKVIKTGKPMIVADAHGDPVLYRERDEKLGYHTRDLLLVPLRSIDRIIGVLCAINKKAGAFEQEDVELLNMIAGTVVLSIENARFAEEVKQAYREVTSMNRAKDKVINHLSHELKTPGAVLSASLNILSRKLHALPDESWKATMERAKRNLERIMEIQYQVSDIMRGKDYRVHTLLSVLLDQIADEMEALVAEKVGEGPVVSDIRERIDELFGPKEETAPKEIQLGQFVQKCLEETQELRSHRNVEIGTRLEPSPAICIPSDPLRKVVDGLIRNAIENTPDEGKIEIVVKQEGEGTELQVIDCGVGITQENQRRIFEGFFTTHETMDYSSKRPYDFRAGGKGADLLRTKIFSERYGFRITMTSSRCRFIPTDKEFCPGLISDCKFCTSQEDCYRSGGTTFTLFFPPVPTQGCI